MFISQNQAHNFFSQPLIQHAVAVIGVKVMLFYAKSTVVKRRGKCCVSRIESTFHLMFFLFISDDCRARESCDGFAWWSDGMCLWRCAGDVVYSGQVQVLNLQYYFLIYVFYSPTATKKQKPPTQLQQSATSNSICWMMRHIGVMFLVILALYLFGSGMQLHHFVDKWYSGLTSILFEGDAVVMMRHISTMPIWSWWHF